MRRKGITPVIAILLLLMMTVAAAGGAYVWISTLQEQLQDQTSEQIRQSFNRDIEIVDLECWSDSTVETVLRNSGDTELDLDQVDVRVREAVGGNLLAFQTYDFTASPPLDPDAINDFSDPGSSARYNITVSDWTADEGSYRIQFVFADEGNIQREGACDV